MSVLMDRHPRIVHQSICLCTAPSWAHRSRIVWRILCPQLILCELPFLLVIAGVCVMNDSRLVILIGNDRGAVGVGFRVFCIRGCWVCDCRKRLGGAGLGGKLVGSHGSQLVRIGGSTETSFVREQAH